MTQTILKSEKLTSLMKDLANQKARVPDAKAEVLRLTNLQRGDNYGTTVINRERPATVPTIGMQDAPSANRTTGVNDADEAKRKNDDLERTLRGEPVVAQPDIKSQLTVAHRQWGAIEDAIEFLERQINAEKHKLAIEYCKSLKPKHDENMRRLFKAFIDVHAAHSDLNDLRQYLIDNGIGLRDVCLTMPDSFLSNPRNKYSEMGDFFRAGNREGYINSIPKEFQ